MRACRCFRQFLISETAASLKLKLVSSSTTSPARNVTGTTSSRRRKVDFFLDYNRIIVQHHPRGVEWRSEAYLSAPSPPVPSRQAIAGSKAKTQPQQGEFEPGRRGSDRRDLPCFPPPTPCSKASPDSRRYRRTSAQPSSVHPALFWPCTCRCKPGRTRRRHTPRGHPRPHPHPPPCGLSVARTRCPAAQRSEPTKYHKVNKKR
ncbi:hypothetical protein F5X68DRAFT_214652 [Plectosphaerella plurivora]|uniref:Uncharacterized protein n=1 Tax=Plectosphaerella plurivora TaxID=936078 RepID=A0A9P8V4I6_9PEZI|nr:hypothetical protein F5X68DRAFT_214652 [Plectosphaerella plurivora]